MTSLARVGDVIEHGQDIPGNVARMADRDTDRWVRASAGHFEQCDDDRGPYGKGFPVETLQQMDNWWPFTVVEVDPEPQPVELCGAVALLPGKPPQPPCGKPKNHATEAPDTDWKRDYHSNGMLKWRVDGADGVTTVMPGDSQLDPESPHWYRCDDPEPHAEHGARSKIGRTRCTGLPLQPAESGPLVLTLPEATAALETLAQAAEQYLTAEADDATRAALRLALGERVTDTWMLLRPTPPREPRTWEQIPPVIDLPIAVEVRRPDGTIENWRRRAEENEDRYGRPGEYVRTLNMLRELGEVREASDGQ